MRIVAGELKGRRLTVPADNRIRPTSEKVKEALFSIAAPYIQDSVVIDLFSGTGNLGLEAISRGAKLVFFGDKSRRSMELTKKNISCCGVDDRCITITGDWEQVLKKITEPADIIFLDPPYAAGLLEKCLLKIDELSLLKDDGIIIAEHGTNPDLPEMIGNLEIVKKKKYGTISVTIYKKQTEDIQ